MRVFACPPGARGCPPGARDTPVCTHFYASSSWLLYAQQPFNQLCTRLCLGQKLSLIAEPPHLCHCCHSAYCFAKICVPLFALFLGPNFLLRPILCDRQTASRGRSCQPLSRIKHSLVLRAAKTQIGPLYCAFQPVFVRYLRALRFSDRRRALFDTASLFRAAQNFV